eukprot:9503902-Pyramimonas_sp.AAC.2
MSVGLHMQTAYCKSLAYCEQCRQWSHVAFQRYSMQPEYGTVCFVQQLTVVNHSPFAERKSCECMWGRLPPSFGLPPLTCLRSTLVLKRAWGCLFFSTDERAPPVEGSETHPSGLISKVSQFEPYSCLWASYPRLRPGLVLFYRSSSMLNPAKPMLSPAKPS